MIVPGIISISSILLYAYLPDLLTMAISSQMVLKDDDSILLQMWTKPPIGVDYEFNFWNIMNPNEVLRGEKPRVSLVGPFCFKQWRTKKIVGWSDNGEMVKYIEYKNHIFAPEGENCKPNMDELVTVINPPIAALGAVIADMVREKVPLTAVTSPIIMSAMSAFLAAHQQNMFMKRSVKEILLGFRINLMDTVVAMLRPLEMLGYKKEDLLPGGGIPNNTFGLMYGKNNTPEGPYEVYTGKNPHYRFVHLGKYKNMGTLPFWKSQYCNQIRGSDGTMFGAGIKRDTKLWAFAADLCRSLYLTYVRDSEYRGIPTFRYGIDETLFGSAAIEPKNDCFCVHSGKNKHRCEVNGILDIGGCQGGAPLIVSKVQFLSTSPDLSLGVEGFAPNKDEHDSFVELEPMTGLPLNGVKKLQFALRVENVPFLRGFSNMRNVSYIPFAYATEKGALPDEWADMMRNFLFTPLKIIYWALLGTAGGAGFFAGRSGVRRLMNNRRARQSVKQIRNSAKNLYKKRNAVDSEISSIKSKNSITELIPKSSYNNDENYANTTNVKLRLKNGNHEQQAPSRFQQLSASRLNPFYLNGQSLMQSYFPQVIPIIMPFPYTMQSNNNENGNRTEASDQNPTSRPNNVNHAPMITNLSSHTTPVHADRRASQVRPFNPIAFTMQAGNRGPLNWRNGSIYPTTNHSTTNHPTYYPNIYPNIPAPQRDGTTLVRRISVQPEARTIVEDRGMSRQTTTNTDSRAESIDAPETLRYDTPPTREHPPIKIESVADSRPAASRADTNLEVANEVARIRSHMSAVDENVNQFEYNNTDDQFYYFEQYEQAPAPPAARNATSNQQADSNNLNDLSGKRADAGLDNDAQHGASNVPTDDHHSANHLEVLSIDQLQSKAGHDQKKNSMDEFNETYADFRRVRKIGYDYDYYND